MAGSSLKFSPSIRWYRLTHSNLFKLGCMKFSWRLIMIVEILIVGLISYWICRDPIELKVYEEQFLLRYVYPHENTHQPIPSVFHGQTELVSDLCSQFVQLQLRKTPRMAIRFLGFKTALHKPVLIEVVKCGGGVGLIQAPGHNSFFVLKRGKYSKHHDTKVFTIFRKAYYITDYESDNEEEYQERTSQHRPSSLNDMSTSHDRLARLPRSHNAPRRYDAEDGAVERFSRTAVTSDLAHNSWHHHQPSGFVEDCQSSRLAVRSPRQYTALSDAERYGIRFPSEPTKMDRAMKFLKRLFSKSKSRRHRSIKLRSSTLPLDNAPRIYRSRSAPRNYPSTRNDSDGQDSDPMPRRDSRVRQPQLAYGNHQYPPTSRTAPLEPRRSSISAPTEYYHYREHPVRPSSPPFREPDKHYELRVRLSQSDEERRRAKNPSAEDQYVTRHAPTSDREDVRQVTLRGVPRTTTSQEFHPRAYENVPVKPVPPYPQYAARNLANNASRPEDDYSRRLKLPPTHQEYGPIKDGRYSDYLVGGAPRDEVPYAYPHHRLQSVSPAAEVEPARRSHTDIGKERPHDSSRAQPYSRDSRIQPEPVRDSAPGRGPDYIDRQPIAKDSRYPASSAPLKEPAKPATHVSSTCRKCLEKNRPVEAGIDRSARIKVSSDVQKSSKPAENRSGSAGRAGAHTKSVRSSAALRNNRLDNSSTIAEIGSTHGFERSAAENSRRERITRVSDEKDEPKLRAQSSKGRSSKREHVEQTSSYSSSPTEDEHPISARRLRYSTPARARPGRRTVAQERKRRGAARRQVHFEVSINGERES